MNIPTKERFYELYWGKGYSVYELTSHVECSDTTCRKYMKQYGIPIRDQTSCRRWVDKMTTVAVGKRRQYYELYWGEGLSHSEIAEIVDEHKSTVTEWMQKYGIPVRSEYSSYNEWDGENDGIPEMYQLPAGGTQDNVTEDTLPKNPDPSKYLSDGYNFDKSELYELYWGYGFSVEQAHARLDTPLSPSRIADIMKEWGIPIRTPSARYNWRPMDGVPPCFEWPDDEDEDSTEDDYKGGLLRAPAQ